MFKADRRRADIGTLIRVTTREASHRGRKIETVDPLVICANRLYPYLPERDIHDYSRTALKIINNQNRDTQPAAQTTLLTHFV
jgi:hypothetical protein